MNPTFQAGTVTSDRIFMGEPPRPAPGFVFTPQVTPGHYRAELSIGSVYNTKPFDELTAWFVDNGIDRPHWSGIYSIAPKTTYTREQGSIEVVDHLGFLLTMDVTFHTGPAKLFETTFCTRKAARWPVSLMDDLILKKHRAETELALLKRIQGFYVTQLTPGNTISPAELALIQYCDTLRQECEENLARWQKALDDQNSEDTLRRLIREEVRAAIKRIK